MKAQIHCAFEDIRCNLKFCLIYFVQIFLSVILIGYSMNHSGYMFTFQKNLTVLDNIENIYIMLDCSDDEKESSIMGGENNSRERMYELYTYIKQSDIWDSYTTLEQGCATDTDVINVLQADENFLKLFGIHTVSGASAEDILSGRIKAEDGYAPAAIGSKLAKQYKIGDRIGDEDENKYFVAAYLPEKAFYLAPDSTADLNYLDDMILAPVNINDKSNAVHLGVALSTTYIITDNMENLRAIQAKSDELDLFSFQFKSFKAQLNAAMKDELQYAKYALLIFGLIISICVVCMISSLFIYIEEHIKEFAIHLTSGASIFDLAFRIVFQIGIIFIIPVIVTAIIFKSLSLMLYLTLISIALIFVITVAPIRRLNSLGISGILRRCE